MSAWVGLSDMELENRSLRSQLARAHQEAADLRAENERLRSGAMSAREIVTEFMRVTAHRPECSILRGPGCTCGQAEELKLVRHEASRWLNLLPPRDRS